MKYMEKGGFQGHALMRLTLYWTVFFLAGLWVTNAVMFLTRMGLTPDSVSAYYLGNTAEFSYPRSMQSMLEVTHAHLPIMGIVVLILTHLMIFSPLSDKTKRIYISVAFLSAFGMEASGWLVRFVHPGFAWLKIICFLSFQAVLAFLLVGLTAFLRSGRPRKSAHK